MFYQPGVTPHNLPYDLLEITYEIFRSAEPLYVMFSADQTEHGTRNDTPICNILSMELGLITAYA